MKYFLIFLFIIGLIYVLMPGPSSIDQFSPIPASLKSDEPGDTVQVPNIAAYFSNFERSEITNFYREDFRKHYFFGKIIPPLTLNHPPRAAYTYVRDLQMSTFLEEYLYPFHGSLFVNGYEPIVESQIKNIPVTDGDVIHINGQYFKSKATIRYYPTQWHIRLIVYLGIWVSMITMFKLFQETLKKEKI